jgi:hypothetical protein
MPESSEPFGRRRWDPLEDIDQPLTVKGATAAVPAEEGETDQPSPTSTDIAI